MKIELAVSVPLFTARHFYACPGIVARRNPTSDFWYYNNSIGIKTEFYPDWTENDWSDPIDCFLENADIPHIGILEREEIPAEVTRNCMQAFLKETLRADRYIYYTNLDEYFIPRTRSFRQRHFHHDGMITGMDTEAKTIAISLYSQRRVLESVEIPFKQFRKALLSSLEAKPWPSFFLLRCLQTKLSLDTDRIKTALQSYREEKEPHSLINRGKRFYQYHGINAYDGWIDFFEDAKSREFIWQGPAFLVFCEHKKCMAQRLLLLADAERSAGQRAIARLYYSTVYQGLEQSRILYFKACFKEDKSVYEKLREKLAELKEREKKLLQEFSDIGEFAKKRLTLEE